MATPDISTARKGSWTITEDAKKKKKKHETVGCVLIVHDGDGRVNFDNNTNHCNICLRLLL